MQPDHVGDTNLGRATLLPLLTSPAFLFAVAVLVVNDWLLKPTFGNWVTGKLSDFAGVFAFPLLLSAVFPSYRKAGFALTAIGFALWKSPVVDAPLAAWNSLGILHLARVVDLTDWIALSALVPSYRLAERYGAAPIRDPISLGRRVAAVVSGLVAILAFTADSVAAPRYVLPDTTTYSFPAARDEIWTGLGALGFTARDVAIGGSHDRLADTLALYIRQPPERAVNITIEVRDVLPGEVSVKLLTAHTFGPAPSTPSIERAFEKQVVEPLRDWVAKRRNGSG